MNKLENRAIVRKPIDPASDIEKQLQHRAAIAAKSTPIKKSICSLYPSKSRVCLI